MTSLRKTLTAGFAALTVGLATITTAHQAQAFPMQGVGGGFHRPMVHHGFRRGGGNFGGGLATGLAIGLGVSLLTSAIAAQQQRMSDQTWALQQKLQDSRYKNDTLRNSRTRLRLSPEQLRQSHKQNDDEARRRGWTPRRQAVHDCARVREWAELLQNAKATKRDAAVDPVGAAFDEEEIARREKELNKAKADCAKSRAALR
jgi:hypothetical protein